ncbi:MAG: tetratricopeptide repeat protein [Bdellovibrionaceae bacterium]|nr:tetratricopeptide repeat protein [Pseudobdellovibrionaceae bacterium]
MKNIDKKWPYTLGILLVLLSACSSKMIIKTEPEGAEVFIKGSGGGKKHSLGSTPLHLSLSEIESKVVVDPGAGEYYELIVEKSKWRTESIMVPVARLSTLETRIDVKLQSQEDEGRIASQMVQHLFNAQKFAGFKEFDRAQVELDKALELDDRFVRALSMRGSIYYLQGNLDESLKWYEKALNIDPKLQDAIEMIDKIRKLKARKARPR